ncbi:MAG: acetyl-CoA carboxylase biotin carboxylase subunit [Defluviicoccus sp.]|nr:acetyl-CoA carboxylase biotin carboxylase subunit [Defluviicoccus sp.]MDG4608275.1 acetyl-CoA carboxylase biotin carboxylase subunit [Defluviicoccus sp.]
MFERILIANRGEIACRIIRTARRLGIRSIAVYSDADADAMHVAMADEAYHIGPAEPRLSYLAIPRLLDIAALAAVDAIHPGYGFLSENAAFADACRAADFVFIGPPAEAIRAMGSKSEAKAIMEANGVPVVPGYHGEGQDLSVIEQAAAQIGYPVIVKAVAGGGGRGLRVVERPGQLHQAVERARHEAMSAFDDGRLLIEKYIAEPRHVEVQVFADRLGSVVHLAERDCSIQRRHQKVIEEAPAPNLAPALRQALGQAAVRAAQAVGYEGAGTVEFLVDGADRFFFMEMNTRLQVEHPVTEMITGIDLVEWQLRIAAGEPLPLRQDDIAVNGHAFEARIYAEDPAHGFLPATGTLRRLRFPDESAFVRIDTGVREGDAVGASYDPMIAKLIVWDADRTKALNRLRCGLDEVQVVGVANNVAFLGALCRHHAFAAADLSTHFIDRHEKALLPEAQPAGARTLALAALAMLKRREAEADDAARRSRDPHSPWHRTDGWRLNDDNFHTFTFRDGGASVDVVSHYRADGFAFEVPGAPLPIKAQGEIDAGGDLVAELNGVRLKACVARHGDEITVIAAGACHRLVIDDPVARADVVEARTPSLKAPMPGRVIAVNVEAGEAVRRGTTVMVLEAMKMEHVVAAPADGMVERIHFLVGDQVQEGNVLVSFVSDPPPAECSPTAEVLEK